MAGFML